MIILHDVIDIRNNRFHHLARISPENSKYFKHVGK